MVGSQDVKKMAGSQEVMLSGTVAEAKRPMLIMGTRYDYMMDNLPEYKKYIRFRIYAALAVIAGIVLLFIQPVLSIAAFFLGTYYYQLMRLQKIRTIGSIRTVMIGH